MSRESKKMIQRTDLRGTPIELGSRVAYNYSGNVASGIVNKITSSEIHIFRDPEFYGTNPISKVKRSASVLVIHEQASTEIARLNKLTLEIDRERTNAIIKETRAELRANALREKLSLLITKISDAWSVDEIQVLVEDLFGRDALDDSFREETIDKVLGL